MKKIIVEVYLPAASKSFDVFIPLKSKMSEVWILLCKVSEELSNGLFIAGIDTILCNRVDGTILNLNMTVEELGLGNGAKLMLM